jgi:hypothetical protein
MINMDVIKSLKDRKIIDVIQEEDRKFVSIILDNGNKISFPEYYGLIVEKI